MLMLHASPLTLGLLGTTRVLLSVLLGVTLLAIVLLHLVLVVGLGWCATLVHASGVCAVVIVLVVSRVAAVMACCLLHVLLLLGSPSVLGLLLLLVGSLVALTGGLLLAWRIAAGVSEHLKA